MKLSDINTWEDLREAAMGWMLLIALGWLGGWIHAHKTVAAECERLGSFYVGSKTFHCTKIDDKSEEPRPNGQ